VLNPPSHPVRPYESTDWRFRQAQWLRRLGRRPKRQDDAWIKTAYRYLGHQHDHVLPADLQPLDAAWKIRQINGPIRWRLEAYLLTAESIEENAKACSLDFAVVEAYEAVFFDVKKHLHVSDYVPLRCLPRHGILGVDPDNIPGLLNLVAYHGGADALKTALRVLLPSDEPASPLADCDPEKLRQQSEELGCRLWLLSVCFKPEASLLFSAITLTELRLAWWKLHQELMTLCSPPGKTGLPSLDQLLNRGHQDRPAVRDRKREDLIEKLTIFDQEITKAWECYAGKAA
jgi:hypothetical protein